ncbi:hypothetical protein [Spiroplasma sp. AdecLV25b]|uniref:hypothetical protein n=1 Tax=Spiroplasma sp. AdecLV25b TaxID=3027162 RepID=UPI0027DF4957|nr:hypothetical protein [Spiroplasma sp. AdecLV25b]
MKEIFLNFCLKNNVKIAKFLLKLKIIDVNTLFENNNTALHLVLQKTYKTVSPETQKMIDLLISAGANISLTNSEGNNVMHIAANIDITYLIEVLLKK